jgi:hypothetical protein
MAGFDLRSASLHLSQYSETSSSYQNTKSLLQFYDPVVLVVPPNKYAPDGMVGISELVDQFYASVKKVNLFNKLEIFHAAPFISVHAPISWHYVLNFVGSNGLWLL